LAAGLYGGLKTLESSLLQTLDADVELPAVKAELKLVRDLKGFYEQQKNVNSLDASAESLSYLTAAAVCWIVDLEAKRSGAAVPRVKQALDERSGLWYKSLMRSRTVAFNYLRH
jgi:hypothetical protein